MESSRRAVEAYRRTRLVDGVTGDDDKVAPVYKFDEISSLLLALPHDGVHELTEYMFRRLDHKSPLVKQKTLRLIKFIVGKSGAEFKREIQRQSAAIRQLFHYQGQPDPLRGDSLNKAVRDTARETITSIFASEDKSPAMEHTSRRIEGFGSTNFDSRPVQEKKTLLSEVVDIGAASIKQGLSMISNHYGNLNNSSSLSKGFGGSYEAPNLRRTISDRESYRESYRESQSYRESYREGTYEEPSRFSQERKSEGSEPTSPRSDGGDERTGEDEEKLLDAATSVGGVRLQPSREAVQAFLVKAQKLNPQKLQQCFEAKLVVHSWQVRFKTLCFLEAVLRQRSLKGFGDVAQGFSEDYSSIADCTESPQATLKEKARKVLSLLQDSQGKEEPVQRKKPEYVEMPDLIDTGSGTTNGVHAPAANTIEDLLGVDSSDSQKAQENSFTEDPFAGMALHNSQPATTGTRTTGSNSLLDLTADLGGSSLFEGLSVSEEQAAGKQPVTSGTSSFFDWQEELLAPAASVKQGENLNTLEQLSAAPASAAGQQIHLSFWQQQQQQQAQPQMMFMNPVLVPTGVLQPGLFQQTFQGMNPAPGSSFGGGRSTSGGLDGFDFSNNSYSAASVGIPKMEETTKAFDFISDHVTAARSYKR